MNGLGGRRTENLFASVVTALRAYFSLREDKESDADIDRRLREGIEMKGTNLWVLMFAIFIASIGLNVNSTAVIIGAMLISPLMGPIMGIGYGVGISDFALVRKSLRHLGMAVLLSLVVSAAYFAISPLTTVQSELLARTTPTIWDVLIALFGGFAGIVGATRRERSTTVIPGVAIATALMPPLCTAGFGIASGSWQYFLGAFYLFSINCVFIAFSSVIVVRAFNVPRKRFVDEAVARRVHRYLVAVVVLTVLPSLYLAYHLVEEEVFGARAARFVKTQFDFERTHVIDLDIDPKAKRIDVTLLGDVVSDATIADVTSRLDAAGLAGAELKVFQGENQKIDVAPLKSNALGDLVSQSQGTLASKDRTIQLLQGEVAELKGAQQRFADIPPELHALYPQITNVVLAESPSWNVKSGWDAERSISAILRTAGALSRSDRNRIEQWLRARLKSDKVRMVVEAGG
jgi:uncharacterized hydrophobic protein (TIGR00271 family)